MVFNLKMGPLVDTLNCSKLAIPVHRCVKDSKLMNNLVFSIYNSRCVLDSGSYTTTHPITETIYCVLSLFFAIRRDS